MSSSPFSGLEAKIRDLEAFDGFVDELEGFYEGLRKEIAETHQNLRATGQPLDQILALERRAQMVAVGKKRQLQEKLRSMDRSALLHRRHVALKPDGSQASDAQVKGMAADVTADMLRTKKALQDQVDQSILNLQILDRSSKRLQATNRKQEELGGAGILGRTRVAMRELWRRERADQFYISMAFGVFFLAAAYVLSQRVWMPPVWLLYGPVRDLVKSRWARSGPAQVPVPEAPLGVCEETYATSARSSENLYVTPSLEEPLVAQPVENPFAQPVTVEAVTSVAEIVPEPTAAAEGFPVDETTMGTETSALSPEPVVVEETLTSTAPITVQSAVDHKVEPAGTLPPLDATEDSTVEENREEGTAEARTAATQVVVEPISHALEPTESIEESFDGPAQHDLDGLEERMDQKYLWGLKDDEGTCPLDGECPMDAAPPSPDQEETVTSQSGAPPSETDHLEPDDHEDL